MNTSSASSTKTDEVKQKPKKQKIAILTDSTSDLTPELKSRYNIETIPLYVSFGSDQYKDSEDLTPPQFFELLVNSPKLPKTSQPSSGDFVKKYKQLAKDHDAIVSVHISAKISGTYASALAAQEQLKNEVNVELIDSGLGTMALGLTAIAAAEERSRSGDLEKVVEATNKAAKNSCALGAGDTALKYLERGGRIGKAKLLMGLVLNLKPIVIIEDGQVSPYGKARSMEKAFEQIMKHVRNQGKLDKLVLIHSAEGTMPYERTKQLRAEFDTEVYDPVQIGATIGTHLGPGMLGVSYTKAH